MGDFATALKRLLVEERASTAIEYGLIAGLIGVTALIGILLLGGSLTGLYNFVSGRSANAMSGG